MASMKNNVSLIGNLGKDPEVKEFGTNRKASFSLATTEKYNNSKGEKVEDTQWHNIVIWGKLADVAGKYLKKGSQVAVDGKIIYRSYETDKGEKRYVTEIVVDELLMLDGSRQAA